MRFTFLHAADLHIDSPLESLGGKDPVVAEVFARANRAAVGALIDETLNSGAKFLVIAGDIFDGDWKDVSTGHFFVRALGRLHQAGVPTYLIKGNHDADSQMSRDLPYPSSVHVFSTRKAETFLIEPLHVALHGRSFAKRAVDADFVTTYPARREGWLNIGLLHTGLDGARPGHESYAPCTPADLARFGYDYWALGHIHAAEIVAKNPWIVYPGNLQGRSPRETGAKGAMRVTVDDGRIVEVSSVALDAARWSHELVDVSGLDEAGGVRDLIDAALARAAASAEGRPVAVRLTLTGVTSSHAHLVAAREAMEDEARAQGFAHSPDCWVERLKLATNAPPRRAEIVGEADLIDIDALVAAAAADPEFEAALADLTKSVAEKLPRELRLDLSPERLAALARDLLNGARA